MISDLYTVKMYLDMRKVFDEHSTATNIYDVDMFTHDVCEAFFICEDPQDIDEDDFMYYQEALVLLLRDDLMLNYYGLDGLSVIHAELMYRGESYYVNKVLLKEV